MHSIASERFTAATRSSPLAEEPLLLGGGQAVERHLEQRTKRRHEWIARVPLIQPGAADDLAHQQATGLQLQQLLLNLTVRDVEGRRDLASIRLLVVLQLQKDLLGGHAANDGFQHYRPLW